MTDSAETPPERRQGSGDMMRFLRRAWLWLVCYHGETCEDCDRRYDAFLWGAPKELWTFLVDDSGAGLLCPRCFTERADAKGLMLRWVPQVIHSRKDGDWNNHETVWPPALAGTWTPGAISIPSGEVRN